MGTRRWVLTELRSLLRRSGLLPHVVRLRGFLRGKSASYEETFNRGLRSAIRPGDVVWDVGANVGHYTAHFLEWTGESGVIYAFEPVPACFSSLKSRFADAGSGVVPMNLALGNREALLPMTLAQDALGATHSLVSSPKTQGETTNVRVVTGDSLVASAAAQTPNVIKIDVEGFEEEVLEGLSETLKTPSLRAIFCEIHFGILDRRGERHAPERIERLLRNSGFNTTWLDASHVGGVR